MAFDVHYDAELHLVKMVFWGELTPREVKEPVVGISKLVVEHKCFRVLSDLREADLNMSTWDVFETPKIITEVMASFGIKHYEVKRAFVVKDHLDDFRFMETVSVNAGHRVRVLTDKDVALKWLMEE